ncbi:hypothetical protein HAX54_006138 [Datura stramonium]|uniref:Uncharacterized protein n=1 Tax=Datura stramonium TaxID=4076 RepID=A0ABS8TBH6_DATST|nr:hypothetical protein [Datura stramonium]
MVSGLVDFKVGVNGFNGENEVAGRKTCGRRRSPVNCKSKYRWPLSCPIHIHIPVPNAISRVCTCASQVLLRVSRETQRPFIFLPLWVPSGICAVSCASAPVFRRS